MLPTQGDAFGSALGYYAPAFQAEHGSLSVVLLEKNIGNRRKPQNQGLRLRQKRRLQGK
jgi:hypothetical protein